jgi:NAD(P)H-dependent FMN reductase
MISIISGTNRAGSNSLKVAKAYAQILDSEGTENQILDLNTMPHTFAFSELYGERSEAFASTVEKYITSVDKFVFVIPEYNGGFPGFLKLFIDAVPPTSFHNKLAGLVGLSSGHTGALRPVDQFTNVLNYLKVDVIALKPKLSGIETLLSEEGELVDERSVFALKAHASRLLHR